MLRLGPCLIFLACTVSAPQRPVEPDPEPEPRPDPVRSAADAARAEFDAGVPADGASVTPDLVARPDAAIDSPPSTGPVAHRFLKGFSGGGAVAIVGQDGKIEWELPVAEREANDAWLMPSGNVLFAFKTGCREVNRAKQTVWEFRAAAGAETHSCQPLPDGNILAGESHPDGTSRLYELDRQKRVLRA